MDEEVAILQITELIVDETVSLDLSSHIALEP